MKLLILTQAVNKDDPVLGFFHRWIEELSKHTDKLTVICLGKGEYDLQGVKVLSLGKEERSSRIVYLYRFLKYIWVERQNYDAVFVHMNQEYVILGGLLWKLWGKKVTMWRNHAKGNMFTDIAVALSDKIFCTSPNSYTAKFSKTLIMPAGIDTELYKGSDEAKPNSILFFGRIGAVKNIHLFIDALLELDKIGTPFHADIIGSPVSDKDSEYEKRIHKQGGNLVGKGKLSFLPAISHPETRHLYARYSLYVNLTPDGSLDKTMIEAMASGVPVLVSNSAFRNAIPDECMTTDDLEVVIQRMKKLLTLSTVERRELGETLRKYAESSHSLKTLVSLLVSEMTE